MRATTPPQPPAAPPDVDRSVGWRGWDDGRAEARARGVPSFCLAEPTWSTGAQRLAWVLAQEDETRTLLADAFVPIRVDPAARPDVAARLRFVAAATTGTAGPPLIVMLTPEGAPFLGYCNLWPEGKDPYPSLRSLLRSVADLAREQPESLEAEAEALAARAQAERPPETRRSAWLSIRDAVDDAFGGLRELPKRPRPTLLWRLLDEADDEGVRGHLSRTLDGLQRGGVLDQLEGSFHRCARDERWVVPHFEKLVPENAALAAVYARAAGRLDRPDLVATAHGAADFALEALDEATMVVAADAGYYTWTPQRIYELLDAAQVQAVALHVNLTRDDSPHVLFRALEPEGMTDVADEPVDVLRERLEGGLRRLLRARSQRPTPARLGVEAPAWPATTLRWLFEAERSGLDLDASRLGSHLASLLARAFDPARGFARGADHWLEDQVAVAAACVAAAEHDPAALAKARQLADLVLEAYVDPASGALCDAPVEGDDPPRPSLDVVDHDLPAAVPATIELLRALTARVGDRDGGSRFAAAADELERRHAGALEAVALTSV
jgi:uncharacterized protein